jgi:Kef-type K+ transport system membrane component KefB
MGIMVDLQSFAEPSVWGLAIALTVAAVLGKQVCGLGVWERGLDRLSIGLGMIPRGEVGLIFAGIGLSLAVDGKPIVSSSTYSALIIMVIATTMLTPPLLKWSMLRRRDSLPETSAGLLSQPALSRT